MDFYDLLKTYEGAGDPNTLFAHAQRGGPFSGVKVSEMNLGQLKDFTNPQGDYGQWVKGELRRLGHRPRVATPMGIGQIVGSTLRQTQKEMNLPDDILFDEKTQRAMISHLAGKRINPDDREATLRGLRQEWEGFKKVDDDVLWSAALNFDNSGTDPRTLSTGKGRLFQFQNDMKAGSAAARSAIDRMAGVDPKQLDMGKEEMGPPPPGQLMTMQPPNEVVSTRNATTSYAPPTDLDTGATTAAAAEQQADSPENRSLMDKIGSFLFPNADDPTDKFKTMLGGIGVGLGQMSAGQAVNLQPYFSQISARKQAAAQAIQDAEQQRIDNQIRLGTLANQTRQTDISAAKLAYDISKTGVAAAPADYEAIAQTYPELADSGLIEAAMMGNKDAAKEITTYIGDRLADSSQLGDASKTALNDYINAGDDVQAKVAALSGLTPDQASKVTQLAGEITGDESLPSNWQTAELLAKDMPHLYKSAGEAFQAIEKMRGVTGGEMHPELIKANIKAGTETQRGYSQGVRDATRITSAANKADRAVKDLIKSGSNQTAGITKTLGKWLSNAPFIGIDAKNAFYENIGYDALASQELTQVQGDMLALIAKDYQGQGEISDREREDMAKRVISGDMDEVTMMAEIQRMKADAAFKKGDAKLFRQHANSSNLYATYAEAEEMIGDFGGDKEAVLEAQRNVGEAAYWFAMDAEGKAGGNLDFLKNENGELDREKYAEYIAPPVSEEFVKYYADSLPLMKDENGVPSRVYTTLDGEIKYINVTDNRRRN